MAELSGQGGGEARECLRQFKRWIRAGLGHTVGLAEWRTTLQSCFDRLIVHLRNNEFNFVETLRCYTLMAEFLELCGDEKAALATLETIVGQPASAGGDWFRNVPPRPAIPAPDEEKKQFRQEAWARMFYIWLKHYYGGQFDEAMRLLVEVRRFIEERIIVVQSIHAGGVADLAPETQTRSEWPSYGTMSRWFYFYAHCLRSKRRFDEADRALLASQDQAHKRLKRRCELAPTGDRMEYETRFGRICTARILTAMGWLVMQEGRLMRAIQAMATAQTMLEGTGQTPRNRIVEARRAIAERRLADPDPDPAGAAIKAMDKLAECRNEYKKLQDTRGQLVCELELVRGHLDITEYARRGTENARREHLEMARMCLTSIDELLLEQPLDPAWNRRRWLQWTRYHLVRGDTARAREALEKAKGLSADAGRQRPSRVDVNIFEGLLFLRQGDLDRAAGILEFTMGLIFQDPVAQSECHLLLAECHIRSRVNAEKAEEHLQKWSILSRSVENSYLHKVGEELGRAFREWNKDFIIRFDDDLTWDTHEEALKRWLLAAARARFGGSPSLDDLSKILGVSPSTLSRWERAVGGKSVST